MSERKSWDVQPSRRPRAQTEAPVRSAEAPRASVPRRSNEVQRPAPRAQRADPVRAQKPIQTRQPIQAVRTRRTQQPTGSLTQRRKKKRQSVRYILLGILGALICLAFFALWQPVLRVQAVSVQGPQADVAKQIVTETLQGTYAYIIPRNSIFFLPNEKMRAQVLARAPQVSAVSISRDSFSSLAVRTTSRAESFEWCGTSLAMPQADGSCFAADIEGLIFSQTNEGVVTEQASTTDSSTTPAASSKSTQEPRGVIRIYGGLDKEIPEGVSPIGARVVSASHIPDALKFVDALRELDAPVTSLELRGDEASAWIGNNTEIKYVLGEEQNAAQLAASTFPTLTLDNGSIQYIDLRFPGKTYVKKYGE